MIYAIITETDFGMEIRTDIKGAISLEKYTDVRILNLYKGKAKAIYKVYADSSCIQIL